MAIVSIGEYLLHSDRNILVQGSQETTLAPLTTDVLVYLAQNPGRVVSSEELLNTFWNGKAAEQSSVHRRISLIRSALGDSAKTAEYIQTVPKRGYRLIAAVAYPQSAEEAAEVSSEEVQKPRSRLGWYVLGGLLLLAFGFSRYAILQPAPLEFEVVSIAFLPLQNGSQQSSLDWFGKGISLRLNSRFKELGLIRVARQQEIDGFAEASSGAQMDLVKAARVLNVDTLVVGRYNLVGSQTAGPSAVTVSVDVFDAPTERLLWSTSISGLENNLGALETKIVGTLSGFLGMRIDHPKLKEVPNDPDAYAAYIKFLLFESQHQPESAIAWIEKTLEHSPDFAFGHVQAGWLYLDQYAGTANAKFRELTRSSLERARQLGMETHPAWLNAWGAYLSRVEGRHAEGERFLSQAVEGGIYSQYVHLLLASGLSYQAERMIRKQLAVYPFEMANRYYLNVAYGAQGRYEDMLESAELGIVFSPDNGLLHAHRAYALMRLGRFDETRSAIEDIAEIEGTGSWQHRDILAHLAVAEGNHQLARETAREFATIGGVASAGLIYAELGDPEAEEYLRNAMHPFYVNLPFRISQMSDRVKNNKAIRSGIEDYGYNIAWRLELCRRSAKVDAEAGAQCVTGDLDRGAPAIVDQLDYDG